jgi:hypothetical protein
MGLKTFMKLILREILAKTVGGLGKTGGEKRRCLVCGQWVLTDLLQENICINCRLKEEPKDRRESHKKHSQRSDNDGNDVERAYEILGCKESDSDATIKKSYRNLAKLCHPDGLPVWAAHRVPEANSLFRELTEAYDLIMRTRKRP